MRHGVRWVLGAIPGVLAAAPALAHEWGQPHPEGEVSLTLVLLLGAGASLIPLWLGLHLGVRRDRSRVLLDGAAAGALVFLLLDFFNLTASLGMGMTQWGFRALLVAAVLMGLWLPAWIEARTVGPAATALLWAAGIGLHSLGEGVIMGYNLTQGLGVVLVPLPVLSFGLHKVVEGATAGLLLGVGARASVRLGALAIAGLPSLLGILAGYSGLGGGLSNLAYALGAGALLFVLPKFLRGQDDRRWGWTQALGMGAGFAFMYLAALLHEL